jgi:sulfur-oxidizing protein SoxY
MKTRREFLMLACAAFASPAAQAQLTPNIVALRKAALEEAVRRVTGGAQPRPGRVKLDLPPLIENGNSVPLTVTVESPMSAADHVRAIHVFTEKNPQPNVISAWLGPRAGRATLTTRARIADTGNVMAVAQLSDGSFWSDRVEVVVTLSACLEDGLI